LIAAAVSATSFCAACRLHDASGSESCEQQRREERFGGLRGGGRGAGGARSFSIVDVGHREKMKPDVFFSYDLFITTSKSKQAARTKRTTRPDLSIKAMLYVILLSITGSK
jgi:hypothetical protein